MMPKRDVGFVVYWRRVATGMLLMGVMLLSNRKRVFTVLTIYIPHLRIKGFIGWEILGIVRMKRSVTDLVIMLPKVKRIIN